MAQKFVRLEDLDKLAEPSLTVSALFLDVASRYNAYCAIEAARKMSPNSELQKWDRLVFPPLQTPEQMVRFFVEGRELDDACQAGRHTERFIFLHDIVNETVRQRGFSDLRIF